MTTHKKQLFTGGILVVLLLNFLLLYYVFGRDIVYKISFSENQKNEKVDIKGVVKKYNVQEQPDGKIYEVQQYAMGQDIVEFSVQAPENIKDFKKIKVNAQFQNVDNPTLELGLRKTTDMNLNEVVYDFDLRTLDNKYLNDFKKTFGDSWTFLEDKAQHLLLLQKTPVFENVAAFLDAPPTRLTKVISELDEAGNKKLVNKEVPQIATLNTFLKQKIAFNALQPATTAQTSKKPTEETIVDQYTRIPYAFRGNMNFFVYYDSNIADKLKVEFTKQDFNQYDGEDRYEVKLWNYQKKLVHYQILEDDGIVNASSAINPQNYTLEIPVAETGLYTLEFRLRERNYDGVVRNFTINMPYVLFNDFRVVDNAKIISNFVTKPLSVFAMKGSLGVKSFPQFQQFLTINGQAFQTQEKDINTFDLTQNINEITTSLNNIEFHHAYNPVAMAAQKLFDTTPNQTVVFSQDSSYEDINFLLAQYSFPTLENDWQKNTVTFDLENVYLTEDNKMTFRLLARGLTGYGNSVSFDSLSFTLER